MNESIEKDLQKQIRSYVSFALAMKPSITLQRTCESEPLSDTAVKFTLDERKKLSRSDVSSLESMIERYTPIRKYLHISKSPEDTKGFNIETCSPTVTFQSNVEYHLVRLNAKQLEVAKEVSQLVDQTFQLHSKSDHAGAKAAYKRLHDYVGRQREELVGDFKNIHQFTDAIGMHGVGRNGNPRADGDCGGAVIFVIIEIFVAFDGRESMPQRSA